MIDNIFQPDFELSAVCRDSLDGLERNKFLVEHVLLMPKHEAWIRRDVSIERASATTRIEGADLDEGAVKNLVNSGKTKFTANEQANLNAIEAYEFVDYLSDLADQPIDELVIRQLNREFLKGLKGDQTPGETPGVYREGQNTVGERYVPPDQGDVPALMRAFAQWLQSDDDLHPAVRAGIAHLQFVAIHPFWDGNGRVARALATLVLQRSEYGFKKLLSFEKFLWAVRDEEYFPAIEKSLGGRYTPDYDATLWLEFWLPALLRHTQNLADHLTDWRRIMDEAYHGFGEILSQRQVDGLVFAMRTGSITRSEYVEITRVSPQTATRDLRQLVSGGMLEAEGRTRNRIYRHVRDRGDEPEGRDDSAQGRLFDADGEEQPE